MDAVFLNPITEHVETIPVEMIGAYVPYAEHLNLPEAARVAAIRDLEATLNFLLTMPEDSYSVLVEGCSFDRLSVPYPF